MKLSILLLSLHSIAAKHTTRINAFVAPRTPRPDTKMYLAEPESMFAALSLLTSSTYQGGVANLAGSVAQQAWSPFGLVASGYALLPGGEEVEEEEKSLTSDGEVDLYRDTPVRYCGYANEVGEAFAPLVPAWVVPASYAVAITYVFADTVDKGVKAYNGGRYMESALGACTLIESFDALIWQLAASVALPGYTIHQVVAATVLINDYLGFSEDPVLQVVPTAAGLLTIPFVVKPLDELAEKLMDWTLRKVWSPYLQSCEISYPDDL